MQTQIQYNRKLQQIIKLVRADVEAEIVPVIKQQAPEYVADSWTDVISAALRRLLTRWTSQQAQQQAEQIAREFVRTAADDNMRRQKSFGIDLYGGDDQLQDYLQAAAFQNAQLIKSIPARYLEQVQNIVVGNMRQGMRPSYIEKQLVKEFGVNTRRAKLIARDQTSRITGEMNRIRQVNSGLKYFRWVTSQDERVRHSHVIAGSRETKYGKGVYKWDELPKNEKGAPMYPGSEINCRCVAVPVTAAQVERNQKAVKK